MDPCFIHRQKWTQKLFLITVKLGQILLRSGHTNAFWSIVNNRGTHLAQSFLMHKCVCKILTTRPVEMDTISAISRTFTFGSFKTISRILLIISGVVISFGRPGLGTYGFCACTTTTKFGKPLLNHSIRRSRVRTILVAFRHCNL